MKGFAQAGRAKHKAKFQQKFMLCPEWAEAKSIFVINTARTAKAKF